MFCPECEQPWGNILWRFTRRVVHHTFHAGPQFGPRRRQLYATCADCRVGMVLSVKREPDAVAIANAQRPRGCAPDVTGQAVLFSDWHEDG